MQHNATLADLSVGCTVRSWRTAPSAWVIERVDDGRAHLRNIYDLRREASLPLAASVYAVTWPHCEVE